jgi:hypothetical protein
MIKIGDFVKVIGTTDCGGFEKECIKIGTICKVVDTCIDKRDGFTVGIESINEFKPARFWYLEKDVEKGHLEWIKE